MKENSKVFSVEYVNTKIFTSQAIECGIFVTLKPQIWKNTFFASQIMQSNTYANLKQQTWRKYKIFTSQTTQYSIFATLKQQILRNVQKCIAFQTIQCDFLMNKIIQMIYLNSMLREYKAEEKNKIIIFPLKNSYFHNE